jgi:hypothetical protein
MYLRRPHRRVLVSAVTALIAAWSRLRLCVPSFAVPLLEVFRISVWRTEALMRSLRATRLVKLRARRWAALVWPVSELWTRALRALWTEFRSLRWAKRLPRRWALKWLWAALLFPLVMAELPMHPAGATFMTGLWLPLRTCFRGRASTIVRSRSFLALWSARAAIFGAAVAFGTTGFRSTRARCRCEFIGGNFSVVVAVELPERIGGFVEFDGVHRAVVICVEQSEEPGHWAMGRGLALVVGIWSVLRMQRKAGKDQRHGRD